MISNYYLETYLHDIIGMTPADAAEHLKASPARHYFRSLRIVYDVPYDPEVHETKRNEFTGQVSPVLAEEDFVPGRVTVKLDGEVIKDARLEHGHGERLRPSAWPPPPPTIASPGEVFFLAAPVFVGRLGPRKDITTLPSPQPMRGWFIKDIVGISVVNSAEPRLTHPKLKPPPKKPKISPRFMEVPW